MNRQPVLEGDRLVMRPLRDGDFAALFAVASDPQIWAVHPSHDRWQEPVFQAFFADAMAGGGAFAIVDKASGAVIGSSRFGQPEESGPGEIEIGWSFLARDFWGKGYNAEFKDLMLAYALAHYPTCVFKVGADNVISRRAMEKIGGKVLSGRDFVTERCGMQSPHVVYAITRESFAKRAPGAV